MELLRLDKDTGKMGSVMASEVFGTIRSIQPFRLTGGTKGEIVHASAANRAFN